MASGRPSSVAGRPSATLRLLWLIGGGVLAQHVLFVAVLGASPLRSLAALLASVAIGVLGGLWIARGGDALRTLGRRLRALTDSGEPAAETIERSALGSLAPGLVETARKLEQHRALRSRAKEASSYKAGFLRSIRHELRTPLNSILGFADVLIGGLEGPLSEDQRESLTVIRRSAARLSQLFEEVIELTLLAADQSPRKRLELDLIELVDNVAEALEAVRGDRPVHIRRVQATPDSLLDRPPGSPSRTDKPVLLGDPERLHKLLLALASHALEHAGGHVLVLGNQLEQAHEVLFVRDPGRVLTAEELAQLQGVAIGSRTRRKGLGDDARLLVRLCDRVAEEHGGFARIESNPEEGTRFGLWLPLPAVSSAPAAQPSVDKVVAT
jgi:signal transduction histidine kinase